MAPSQTFRRPFDNFFTAWNAYYNGTQLPDEFVKWTCVYVIASVLQDYVYLNEGTKPLTPNLYIWLIAPPGTAKSQSAEPGIDILKRLHYIDVYDGQLTSLYLYKHMSQQTAFRILNTPKAPSNPRVSIYSDELAATVGNSQMADELIKSLTVMYSNDYKYGTGAHNLINIEKPVVNWLACTSPSWLRRSISRDYLDSGFIARIISVYEPLRQRYIPIKFNTQLRWALLQDLSRMHGLRGEFSLTAEAQKLREEWAERQFKARMNMDELAQAVYGREEEHVLKVAMIIAAANGDKLEITKRGFQAASKIVLSARANSYNTLLTIATSPLGQLKIYLFNMIKQECQRSNDEPITEGFLRSRTRRRIDDTFTFNRLIKALCDEGLVLEIKSQGKREIKKYSIAPTNGTHIDEEEC